MSVDLERLRASLLSAPAEGDFVQEDGGEGLPLTPAAVLFPSCCAMKDIPCC